MPQDEGRGVNPDIAAANANNGSNEPVDKIHRLSDSEEPDTGDHDGDGATQPGGDLLSKKVLNFNRFIDEAAKGLDPISAMIWLTLFRFARGGIARASQETIAKRLGLSPTTVYRHISILEKKKLLRVLRRGRRGGHSNTYQLGILPLPPVSKRPERSVAKPR